MASLAPDDDPPNRGPGASLDRPGPKAHQGSRPGAAGGPQGGGGEGSRPGAAGGPQPLLPWLGRVLRDLPAQAGLYGPWPALDRGLRERVMLAVTAVSGSRYSAFIHRGWAELMSGGPDAREDVALAYAREAALAGELPPGGDARTALEGVFAPREVRAIDAAIASAQVASLAGDTADDLFARLRGSRSRDPAAMLGDAVVVAAATPVALPLLALGALFRQAARSLPPVEIVVAAPAKGELFPMMLGEVARKYSGLPLVRALAAGRLPFAMGLRCGVMEATVRLGRARLEIEGGIAADAALVVEGEPDAVVSVVTGQTSPLRLINEGKIRLVAL